MLKPVFSKFSVALVGLLIFASCTDANDAVDEVYLRIQEPFGFTWDVTDKSVSAPDNECNQLIETLGVLIDSSRKEQALLECRGKEYSDIYLTSEDVPKALQEGDISIGLLGDRKPVHYTYSFLHDWRPDNLEEKSKLREAHAAKFKAQLVKLYGSPDSVGYFDQSSEFGFIVDEGSHQPCAFWLVDKIGILLCSERVIMMDGTEMSLSFINFAQDRANKDTRNLALIAAGKESEPSEILTEKDESSAFSKATLKELADLVYSDEWNRCEDSDLAPIDEVWARSPRNSEILGSLSQRYSGDDLAEYIFENSHELEEQIPEDDQNLIIMFLLKQAAGQGSAAAMNEIGASLLHCYQGIQQDINGAREWLNKAAEAGDTMAMQSLAGMHLAQLLGSTNPKEDALILLEQCSELSPETCSDSFQTLNSFVNSGHD